MDVSSERRQGGEAGYWPRLKDILVGVYRRFAADRVMANAAGVTFYALLAMFPAVAAMVSIFGLFADPHAIATHLGTMSGFVPGGGIDLLRSELDRLAAQGPATLGVGFLVSLVISLWFANSGMTALFDALNIVYEEAEKRGYVKLYAVALAFTAGMIVLLLLALAFVIALPVAMQVVGRQGSAAAFLDIARWPILLLLITAALSCIYRWGPSHSRPHRDWLSWGAALAAVLWLAASALFSWYAANFGSYNKTYGSLGAVAGFMTWMWLSIAVVLLGGEVNAVIEQRRRRRD